MKLPYSEAGSAGYERARESKRFRDLASEISHTLPQALTLSNRAESEHGSS